MGLIKLASIKSSFFPSYRQSDPLATFHRKAQERSEKFLGGYKNTSECLEAAIKSDNEFYKERPYHERDINKDLKNQLKLEKAYIVEGENNKRADKAFNKYNKYKTYIKKRNLKRIGIYSGLTLGAIGALSYLAKSKNKES